MEDFSDVPQLGPSINRKGGVRLHPVRDGVIPFQWEPRSVKQRDQGGNKLTDVTDPSTGFCMYATSPLDTRGMSVIQPTPIVPVSNPKRDAGLLPQRDEATGIWYIGTGSNKRAIRTVSMDDSPLPPVPTRTGTKTQKGDASRAARAIARATGPDVNPNRPARTPSIPRSLVDAYITGLAKRKGKPVPKITPDMRRRVKAALEARQDIDAFCAND